MNAEKRALAMFEHDTADHVMRVLHDDGLYRHLWFGRPGSSFYHFALVTWPGYLAIVGDMGDYVFRRIEDMFDFFAADREGINPSYWSQKLEAPRPQGVEEFSSEVLSQYVIGWFKEMTGPIDPEEFAAEDYFVSIDGLSTAQRFDLSRALERDVIEPGFDGVDDIRAAHERIADFEWFADGTDIHAYRAPNDPAPLRIEDSWEWELWDYSNQFLWCCWAIHNGIKQYKSAKETTK